MFAIKVTDDYGIPSVYARHDTLSVAKREYDRCLLRAHIPDRWRLVNTRTNVVLHTGYVPHDEHHPTHE